MKPVTIPNAFQAQAGPIPLAQLDGDFGALAAAVNDFGTYSNYLVDTGTVNAMVATIPAGTTFALAAGLRVQVQVAATTTSTTPTLNVSSTGAKTIVNADNTAVSPGQFVAGQFLDLMYDGTSYPTTSSAQTNGSFTGTLTGMTGATTGTVLYTRIGNIVTLTFTSTVGTSNSTACTLTGLPAICQPATLGGFFVLGAFVDNSILSVTPVIAQINPGSGTIIFFRGGSATGFTASGNKGLTATSLTYSVA